MILIDDGRETSKTQGKYLPPVTTKITDPNTICTYMEYFKKFSKATFQEYVNITLHIAVIMNAYLIWRNFQQFFNLLIHFSDFLYLKKTRRSYFYYITIYFRAWNRHPPRNQLFLKTHIKPFLLHCQFLITNEK